MNIVRVRWKHKSENFPSVEAARTWAQRHPGSRMDQWNGVRWIPLEVYPSGQNTPIQGIDKE